MAKTLTAAAVKNYRPGKLRREIPDGGCPGLHLVIQPGGARSWAVRFRRPGGRPAKLTIGTCDATGAEAEGEPAVGAHLTLAAARRLAAEVNRQRAFGRDPAADHVAEKRRARAAAGESASGTFGAVARAFVEQHKVRRTGKPPRRWREVARNLGLDYPPGGGEPTVIKGGLAVRWADRPIAEIDGHDIHAVIDEARRFGTPGLAPRNAGTSDARGRKVADALGTLFKWATRHRHGAMAATNPCLGAWRPDAPAARDRVLNFRRDVRGADELRWLWAACNTVAGPFGAVAKLLLLTGCRRDEIARMRWNELSDDFTTLRLAGSRTKNNRGHDVPLSALACAIVASSKRIEGCPFVFSSDGKTPVSGFSKFKKRLDAEMLAAAVAERGEGTIPPWRIHDLRRTAATGMASIGIPPHIVEAALNYVSGAKGGVAGTYNREQYEPEKRATLERWAAHVEALVSGRPATVVPLRGRA